jgi:hypothetical protein
MARKGQERA